MVIDEKFSSKTRVTFKMTEDALLVSESGRDTVSDMGKIHFLAPCLSFMSWGNLALLNYYAITNIY